MSFFNSMRSVARRAVVNQTIRSSTIHSTQYSSVFKTIGSNHIIRSFAAEAGYLDKEDVTTRVLEVVKKFEKVCILMQSFLNVYCNLINLILTDHCVCLIFFIIDLYKNILQVQPEKVTDVAHFVNDLGLDSLDTVELVMALEDEFAIEIPDADAEKILTCDDAVSYLSNHINAK